MLTSQSLNIKKIIINNHYHQSQCGTVHYACFCFSISFKATRSLTSIELRPHTNEVIGALSVPQSCASSTSFEGREEFSIKAWQVIQNHPLVGDYGYYIDIYGIGSYAHNILSAWADFGILGFILFLGLSIYLLIFSLNKIIFKKSSDKKICLLFLFSITLILGYLTAKDYSFMFFGLSLGLYVNYLQSIKYKEK